VRHVWVGVHVPPDAVAADFSHDADALLAGELHDRGADVTGASAVADDGDAHIAAASRDIDDALRIGGRFTDDKRRTRVAVVAIVAEEGNVGRAAKRLRVAQPPISRHIRALEDEIGTSLFARTPRGMTLLSPGRVFLEHGRRILAAVDRAVVLTRAENEEPRPPSVFESDD